KRVVAGQHDLAPRARGGLAAGCLRERLLEAGGRIEVELDALAEQVGPLRVERRVEAVDLGVGRRAFGDRVGQPGRDGRRLGGFRRRRLRNGRLRNGRLERRRGRSRGLGGQLQGGGGLEGGRGGRLDRRRCDRRRGDRRRGDRLRLRVDGHDCRCSVVGCGDQVEQSGARAGAGGQLRARQQRRLALELHLGLGQRRRQGLVREQARRSPALGVERQGATEQLPALLDAAAAL